MEVYLLRHGEAVAREEWKGAESDRPLAKQGAARLEREAARLASLSLGVQAIITSPLVRARQTAEIVARHLRIPTAVSADARLSPGFDQEKLRQVLAGRGASDILLLVGHEPDFGRTIARCIGGGRFELKTGALAKLLIVDPGSEGTLAWLIPPDVIAR